MKIAVPKEIKNNENRVGLTPDSVYVLVRDGHQVFVETNAGLGSGFSDDAYQAVGAEITFDAATTYAKGDLIVKVKEPLPSEYDYITENKTIFTYFHFAASQELTSAMINSGATCIAYETITGPGNSLPLLRPMSEVAGRLSSQIVAEYLMKTKGGKGKLMGGVIGTEPANVLVLGAGIVGTQAALVAAGMGANVYLLDISIDRLHQLKSSMPANVQVLFSSEAQIKNLLPRMDAVIGAVLIPGGKAPLLIKKDMLSIMEKGSVLLDVAVDQGGCIETVHVTSHQEPVYELEGILHYGVPNMPGAVPRTSTIALNNATLPFTRQIAKMGWKALAKKDNHFKNGVNIYDGKIALEEVAHAFGMTAVPLMV